MLDKPQLRLAYPAVFTALDMDAAIRAERKRTRKAIRVIWFTSMVVTVMVAAAIRKQVFVELPWWIVPLAGVSVNLLYWAVLIKLLFPSVPKEERV